MTTCSGPPRPQMLVFALLLSGLVSAPAGADEGMWPYNLVPKEQLKKDHGFTPSEAFLKRAMASSVRFNNGGSGSFVSGSGLVMTNHHVGADCIQKLSTGPGKSDLMQEGYLARTRAEELRCPALELNQLREIEDVTDKVDAAANSKTEEADKNKARKAEMAKLEKACSESTGQRCDVVTLYSGGAYHLYKYKKYTDVRLVFAPEIEAAFFGGDPDNFTFPRYCLDAAFFRVYEDKKPVATADHFAFSAGGPKEDELVFVSGNPGSTDRFSTVSELIFLRDTAYPFVLKNLKRVRAGLRAFGKAGGEDAERLARDDLFGVENSIKALTGYVGGLRDDELMKKATVRETRLQKKVGTLDAASRARLLEAWPKLSAAWETYSTFYQQYAVTERWLSPSAGPLAGKARTLLRLATELKKDDGKRLREYRDSNLKSLELGLFSEAPIHKSLEIARLTWQLEIMRDVLGVGAPTLDKVLAGKTPAARAKEVIEGTQVHEVAFRKKLRAGGVDAVNAAKDPLIEFVRSYDETARFLRQRYEDEVQALERTYAGRIAEAYAKAFGTSIYPDATFTLRLNWGVVKGYAEGDRSIPWRTQLGGMYVKHRRAAGKGDYALPQRWQKAISRVDLSAPVNFVSTNDIIGGNSGSPVFNKKGQVVGLIFDGNIHQLPNRFLYTSEMARSVSVHSGFIVHALERVYGGEELVAELRGR